LNLVAAEVEKEFKKDIERKKKKFQFTWKEEDYRERLLREYTVT